VPVQKHNPHKPLPKRVCSAGQAQQSGLRPLQPL